MILNDELLSKYKYYREQGKQLNSRILREVTRTNLLAAAGELRLKRGNTLVFESEHETDILMDYIIYDYRFEGQNGLERYLNKNRHDEKNDEKLIEAMLDARYSIFQISESVGDVVVNMVDILRQEVVSVVDIALCDAVNKGEMPKGLLLAGRLIVPETLFCMTTGAMLPVTSEASAAILPYYENNYPHRNFTTHDMSPEETATISTYMIRMLLNSGASRNVKYENPDRPAMQAKRKPEERYTGASRNAPCPCGSGKKFKKCCLNKIE